MRQELISAIKRRKRVKIKYNEKRLIKELLPSPLPPKKREKTETAKEKKSLTNVKK